MDGWYLLMYIYSFNQLKIKILFDCLLTYKHIPSKLGIFSKYSEHISQMFLVFLVFSRLWTSKC